MNFSERNVLLDQFVAGPIETIPSWNDANPVSILRLDQLQSWVQGNKYYKLKYTLQNAFKEGKTSIVSKGGLFSNHLSALGEACSAFQLKLICLVRTHQKDENSPTIKRLISSGAQIEFLPPDEYDAFNEEKAHTLFPESYFIAEGGLSKEGILGSSEIATEIQSNHFDYIAIAGGSMCTAVGLMAALSPSSKLIIVPAWKGCTDVYLQNILESYQIKPNCDWEIWPQYHFGGFGKWNESLYDFMYDCTSKTKIPLDPVYTGKLLYGLNDKMQSGYFEKGKSVLVIHTGGLQGLEGYAYRWPVWREYNTLFSPLAP